MFQRLATRMVKGLQHLPYIQHLQCLNVCPLEKQRRWADQIPAYLISHGRYDLQQDVFFTLQSFSHLRGHDLKLRHRPFHLACRKVTFSVRIVEPWNKLPPFFINSPSIVVFKNRLDACWETIFGSDEPHILIKNFSTWFSAVCAIMTTLFRLWLIPVASIRLEHRSWQNAKSITERY